ncbi:hypothetical protein DFJ74DRAFT_711176 [Hyaloraphidium curvatum]|nr:hypothetical protein DFJ74DRAFT_711176 [Hyaloraphidium curvatum]
MSVILETSAGDIVIDLEVDRCPRACTNFIKLCKMKYYNFSLFYKVQKNFLAQAGDPTGTGSGGESVWGLVHGQKRRYFVPEFHPKLKHDVKGRVSFACVPDAAGNPLAGSQFFITLGENLDYLNGKAAVFGQVAEGFDVLDKLSAAIVDEEERPMVDIRIKHTIALDDPFDDVEGMVVPPRSPDPTPEMLRGARLREEDLIKPDMSAEELEKEQRRQEAEARALTLEMVGDLPFAEIKPPENILFVCKLNPVTRDEDLELIFSRFGTIRSCEIIRDKKTNDSLQYAFIEFENREDCEEAYFKMDNVLIDDRRIHVDFSQSVSKLHKEWMVGRRKALGFGGNAELEKRSKYRDERAEADSYELVFEAGDRTLEEEKPAIMADDEDHVRAPPSDSADEDREDRMEQDEGDDGDGGASGAGSGPDERDAAANGDYRRRDRERTEGGRHASSRVRTPYERPHADGRHDDRDDDDAKPANKYSAPRPKDRVSDKECRIYVGNLAYECGWQDLKDFMRQAGDVVFADVLTNAMGRSKGCGVVEFATPEEAKKAIETLNDKQLMGRPVFIREDRESDARFGMGSGGGAPRGGGRGGYGGGGGWGGPRDDRDVAGRQLFLGNVSYFRVDGGELDPPFLLQLPYVVAWQDIKDLFREAGSVIRADVHETPDRRPKGTGIVLFEREEDARKAISMFDGYDWHGRRIEVREDRFPGMPAGPPRGFPPPRYPREFYGPPRDGPRDYYGRGYYGDGYGWGYPPYDPYYDYYAADYYGPPPGYGRGHEAYGPPPPVDPSYNSNRVVYER